MLLAGPFCAAALLWDKLPDRMPIHWNAQGQVDGYAGKFMGALSIPITSVVAVLFISLLAVVDPRLRNQDPATRANSLQVFRSIRIAFSLFLAFVSVAVLFIGVGVPLEMSRIISLGLGLLLLVMGNLLGKVRPNYFMGIRTPWTLESPEVWQKTHRLGGKIMVGAAIVLLAGAMLVPMNALLWFLLSVTTIMILVPVVYSLVVYKKLQRSNATASAQ